MSQTQEFRTYVQQAQEAAKEAMEGLAHRGHTEEARLRLLMMNAQTNAILAGATAIQQLESALLGMASTIGAQSEALQTIDRTLENLRDTISGRP
jgi:hypothetical protein